MADTVVERDERLKALWYEGELVRHIATRLGMAPSQVCVRAERLGLPRRSRPLEAGEREAIVELYRAGKNIAEVATVTGRHRDTVRRVLVQSDTPLREARK
jgi:hypothetical protein